MLARFWRNSKLKPNFRKNAVISQFFGTNESLNEQNSNADNVEYRYQSPDTIISSYLGQPSPFTHPHKLTPGQTSQGLSKDEYAERRNKLMFHLKRKSDELRGVEKNSSATNNLVILLAATSTFSGPDVPHPFRQESNFFYLTGYTEADSILILHDENSGRSVKSYLFVSPKDPQKELWEGPRAGVEGALYLTGVDSAGLLQDVKRFLDDFVGKFDKNSLNIYYDPTFAHINANHQAKNLLDQSRLQNFKLQSPYSIIHELRWIKSKAEVDLLRESCNIASKAFVESMKFSKNMSSNLDENYLLGKFDFECRLNGAKCLAYPPVVAGGNRANTIHYLNADQIIKPDEMVLMDAGCDFGGYASDITRCWPISGRFSPEQKALYEMLLKVQMDLIDFASNHRPISLRDLFLKMLDFLSDGLIEIGIISKEATLSKGSLADYYCPHHVSHYLGLDVHDTEYISKARNLEPGVVITIEPGLYFKQDDKTVPERFRGVGLRIEDDVLIKDTGVEVLSKNSPKTVSDIERIMAS